MNFTSTTRAIVVALFLLALAPGCSASTTLEVDSGNGTDAALGTDGGGGADSGTMIDSGSATDAGTMIDAGSATDAGSTTDANGATDGGCITLEGALNQSCTGAGDCPAGFVCQSFSGVVLTQSCEIRCDDPAFTCPCGTVCQDHSDKVGSWRQCDQL